MSQATLSGGPYVNSNLFSSQYLDERVRERDEWECDDDARAALEDLQDLYELEGDLVRGYGEDALIDNWIDEVLDVLGFGTQDEVTLPDGGGFVDELLFETPGDRREAARVFLDTDEETDLFERGVGLVEAKQWDADFTSRFSERRSYRDASHQIKHYLEKTPENIQWGVLTNGRKWRLYGTKDYETETYYEVDLPELLERGELDAFKYFYVFFRPSAFRASGGAAFLDSVRSESETAAQELGESLQDNVFTALRVLGRGFVETNDLDIGPDDDAALDELKEQSLVLLYRLMFVLYAEARGLIHPEGRAAEREYEENFSLDALRLEIHDEIGEVDEGFDEEFSTRSTRMWSRLEDLFALIDEGEADLGIPPYNGGLFDHEEHDFLTENEVSDRHLAEVIYRLSTTENDEGRYVLADYADLDTRHLGSVYEGLLEHQFEIAPEAYAAVAEDGGQVWKPATAVTVAEAVETVPEGGLYVVNDQGERKATGAYYTPDYVVTYIIEETVGPLVDEIRDDLQAQGFERGTQEYLGPFLQRVTDLKVLDPAMGSGHFLTTATSYLAERVMEEVRETEAEVGAVFDEEFVRREIAKECIYGVDLNGMAVELAKLSMWLETLAADRPLAFLDHHLKEGNSLVGSDIEAIEELESDASDDDEQASLASFGVTREGTIERLMDIYGEFLAIENQDIEDVREMKRRYEAIEEDELRTRLVAMANVHTAERFDLDLPGGAYERMARALEDDEEWAAVEETDWFSSAQSLAEEQDFFHWKLEFPEAFYEEDGSAAADAGFDAVIGNPPYVNIMMIPDRQVDYLGQTYDTAFRRFDLYVLFSELAYDLTADGGFHSYIVPDKLLTESYGKKWRRETLSAHSLVTVFDLRSENVFSDASNSPIVFVACRTDRDAAVEIVETSSIGRSTRAVIPSAEFRKTAAAQIRIDWSEQTPAVLETIRSDSFPLSRVVYASWGAQPGNASRFVFDQRPDDGREYNQLIKGAGVGRYTIRYEGQYLWYDRDELHRPGFPELFEGEKLCIPKVTGNQGLTAAYDDEGYYTDDSIINVIDKARLSAVDEDTLTARGIEVVDQSRPEGNREDLTYNRDTVIYSDDRKLAREIPIQAVLAILNSTAIDFYYSNSVSGNLNVFPEHVRRIPIKYDAEQYQKLKDHAETMQHLHRDRQHINQNVLDYVQPYSEGETATELGRYYAPDSVGDSGLTATTEDNDNLRIGTATCEREDETTVTVHATARYKPEDEDAHETDQYGYTETDPIPAMRLTELTETEADLIEAFVPVAVEEGGGFAGFRDNATKTISPLDRLEAITLPEPDEVADDLERYWEAVERAEELEAKIERTDELIDEIVYELYGLTEEEIEIVEAAVGD